MRTILVTGHSNGIGFAITKALLASGHKVVGISRSQIDALSGLQQLTADFSTTDQAEAIAKQLIRELPNDSPNSHTIDAVVCNAGAGQFGALETFSADQIQECLQLNLTSPLVLLKTLLPGLKQHSRSDIIFIASESALRGGRYGSVYSAAKFGIRGAAQALRHECAASNCHVGIVNPGMVRTDFFNQLNFEPGSGEQHALNSSTVATAVLSMLNTPDNAVIEEINVSPLQHVVKKKGH